MMFTYKRYEEMPRPFADLTFVEEAIFKYEGNNAESLTYIEVIRAIAEILRKNPNLKSPQMLKEIQKDIHYVEHEMPFQSMLDIKERWPYKPLLRNGQTSETFHIAGKGVLVWDSTK